MNSIFSQKGKEQLDKIIKKGVLCAFDFDGTLAPIVSQPDDARLPDAIGKRMATLTQLTPVAILTGRAIDDITPRLTFTPAYLIGNHGLEGIPGWEKYSSMYRDLCARWDSTLRETLPGWSGNDSGIDIENKTYSLAVHYRHAADPDKTGKALLPFLKKAAPDALIVPGKYMVSLVPPDAPNKGIALNELMTISQAPSVLYAGDDITDEDVFKLKRKDLVSIHVEKSPASAAPWYIETHEDMIKLLDDLINRLQSFKATRTG
ncbi:trehalose-phosphatase [Oxalobacter vibrioformis]|uniref:Trehalose 6-phosphate phosphatase n=1 Tax=Oxalobacter vibrioformis TaxID=933080 RepID=A0A9E9LYJ4_9BURK|nr:trehalose-phosphatase [Oxalobacter vibrioformis]WAW09603.1 trehalose-phosphatase [Oxalobacter vibrioformis]